MFDLQALSSVAPNGDLIVGIIVMILAAVVANLIVIPALISRDRRFAKFLLVLAALGCIAFVATLAIHPRGLYLTVLVYVMAFLLVGLVSSSRSAWPGRAARVTAGSLCMLSALGFAYFVAYLPR